MASTDTHCPRGYAPTAVILIGITVVGTIGGGVILFDSHDHFHEFGSYATESDATASELTLDFRSVQPGTNTEIIVKTNGSVLGTVDTPRAGDRVTITNLAADARVAIIEQDTKTDATNIIYATTTTHAIGDPADDPQLNPTEPEPEPDPPTTTPSDPAPPTTEPEPEPEPPTTTPSDPAPPTTDPEPEPEPPTTTPPADDGLDDVAVSDFKCFRVTLTGLDADDTVTLTYTTPSQRTASGDKHVGTYTAPIDEPGTFTARTTGTFAHQITNGAQARYHLVAATVESPRGETRTFENTPNCGIGQQRGGGPPR